MKASDVLAHAADQFRNYASLHRAKTTQNRAKVQTNEDYAETCEVGYFAALRLERAAAQLVATARVDDQTALISIRDFEALKRALE